jgi:hypothetical protein
VLAILIWHDLLVLLLCFPHVPVAAWTPVWCWWAPLYRLPAALHCKPGEGVAHVHLLITSCACALQPVLCGMLLLPVPAVPRCSPGAPSPANVHSPEPAVYVLHVFPTLSLLICQKLRVIYGHQWLSSPMCALVILAVPRYPAAYLH